MPRIDRKKFDDAKKVVDSFSLNVAAKHNVLSFLSEAIIYTHSLDSDNWNLNLDNHGKFVRFNVGQVYCIEMYPDYVSILALKNYVPRELHKAQFVEFKGYLGRKKILSHSLQDIPDCLVKIQGSVGCHLKYERGIIKILPLLQEANRKFIEIALAHTQIKPWMVSAHSPAFITYLSQQTNKQIFNPLYFEETHKHFPSNPLEDIEISHPSLENLSETERQSVIQSRIGQGEFRVSLLKYWGGCSVTGCREEGILRASHIKPWREANNQERLDVFNGLLLIPNLDIAFDGGYISFSDDGRVLISPFLDREDQLKLGIHSRLFISGLTENHIRYLQYHRKYVFKD
jgi:hypothetical protein